MIEMSGQVARGEFRLTIDLEIGPGTRLAVIGASGSGKSTLLDALAGFLPLEAGHLHLDGQDMSGLPPARRPVSILFQDGNLLPALNVEQNVALGLRPDLRLSEAEWIRVRDVLDAVDLRSEARRRPADLSGGQQTRAALARILLRDQPVVLMDEPFSALDPGLRAEMMALTDRLLGTERTLVLVTHDFREAAALCDRLILLDRGEVVCSGGIDTLQADPPDRLKAWL